MNPSRSSACLHPTRPPWEVGELCWPAAVSSAPSWGHEEDTPGFAGGSETAVGHGSHLILMTLRWHHGHWWLRDPQGRRAQSLAQYWRSPWPPTDEAIFGGPGMAGEQPFLVPRAQQWPSGPWPCNGLGQVCPLASPLDGAHTVGALVSGLSLSWPPAWGQQTLEPLSLLIVGVRSS